MLRPPPLGHVVKDYYIGSTNIVICDDCCYKTKEEVDRAVAKILRDAYNAIVGAQRKKEE